MEPSFKFVFFGGEPLAVPVLEKLKEEGLMPDLIICNPDRPSGRGQELSEPPAKVWAEEQGIEVFQPSSYKDGVAKEKLSQGKWDVFVVVAYNFILPKWLLDIPERGVVNVHPSLLPKLRGSSPIRTAIKDNLPEDVGVTIMLLDEKMDEGPTLEQEELPLTKANWPMSGPELDKTLAELGGELLAEILPAWVADELSPQEQEHKAATYCGKLSKSDSELSIDPQRMLAGREATKAWHTINAFVGIGDTFFMHNGKRVKIKKAELTNGGSLRLLRVIPEGKKEIDFNDYLNRLT
ncbi:MAG: methionyl-tRNA formyltransferase [Candidatus Pacebacteria bacterium]|nr:methionyl-tRNA formyltransferase [Candidatus Paceibacterota bacterium]